MRHVTSPIWGAPVADPGEGSGGPAPLKNFFGDRAPLLSQGLENIGELGARERKIALAANKSPAVYILSPAALDGL